jgi:hypothetical protein
MAPARTSREARHTARPTGQAAPAAMQKPSRVPIGEQLLQLPLRYDSCSTAKMWPAGSVNHATSGPCPPRAMPFSS